MAEIETNEEQEAFREAWRYYPGRVTNNYIHKDFLAGWVAGRDWARNQEVLTQIEEQRQKVSVACPHGVPFCDADECRGGDAENGPSGPVGLYRPVETGD